MIPVPEMTAVEIVFGGTKHMPKHEDIPEEFKDFNRLTKWNAIVERWFFRGLPPDTELIPKEGVDPKKALRAIGAILGSFEPKHEHKVAACAYLLSEWFHDVRIPAGKGDRHE